MGIGLVNFVDSSDPNIWADKIQQLIKEKNILDKTDIENAVKLAGFDIVTETQKLKEYYNFE